MGFLSDIAELAKAGYSVSDVKELLSMNKEKASEDVKENEPEDPSKETGEPEEKTKDAKAKSEVIDDEGDESKKDETDYKAKYEELLKKTQADNIRRDLSSMDTKELSNEEYMEKLLKEMF